MIPCKFVQSKAELSYRRCVCATKLMRPFSEAALLFEKQNDDATSGDSRNSTGALSYSCLDSADLLSRNGHDVLLYIKAAATHTQRERQNQIFSGRAFLSHAASPLHKLRSLHTNACKQHSLSFSEKFFTKIL